LNFRSCSKAGRPRVGAKYPEGPISETFPYGKYNRKRKGKKNEKMNRLATNFHQLKVMLKSLWVTSDKWKLPGEAGT
jgi:hypothetical protein